MTCPSGLTRRPNVLSVTHRVIHAITNGYAGPIDGEGDAGDTVVEKAEAADPALLT